MKLNATAGFIDSKSKGTAVPPALRKHPQFIIGLQSKWKCLIELNDQHRNQ